jgi:proline iminopeptidase
MLALLYAAGADTLKPARLALISPAPLTRAHRQAFEAEFARRQRGPEISRMRNELASSGLRESDPAAHRQRNFEIGVAGYFADPAAASELTPFRVVARVQQSVWESLGEFDLISRISGLQIPASVIYGRDDPIPSASSVDAAHALGAELVVLDACGHVPYVEQPDRLFAALETFLQKTRPR